MSNKPVANYPSRIWDGSSPTRPNPDGNILYVERPPDAYDWNQLITEMIAVQSSLGGRLNVTGRSGPVTTIPDSTIISLDLATSDKFIVKPLGDRTLAIQNPAIGQQFTIILLGDGTARSLTWWSGIVWLTSDGLKPTPTSTTNKRTVVTFIVESIDTYLGFLVGTQS